MKKNIYTAQINYLHGKSTFLPYAAGTLIAMAKSNRELDNFFCFNRPIFIRENTDKVLEGIKEPYLVGFSNYIWNHEYNKVLASKIKKKHPDCFILFGGHHISPDTSLMEKEEYIDIMIFGEDEETFEALLLALKNGTDLDEVRTSPTEKTVKLSALPRQEQNVLTIRHPILRVFLIQFSKLIPT